MDRSERKQKPSPFVRSFLKYISQHRHRVPVPDELTITPPNTAVEEQNEVQASGTWNENGMELDRPAAQPDASNDRLAQRLYFTPTHLTPNKFVWNMKKLRQLVLLVSGLDLITLVSSPCRVHSQDMFKAVSERSCQGNIDGCRLIYSHSDEWTGSLIFPKVWRLFLNSKDRKLLLFARHLAINFSADPQSRKHVASLYNSSLVIKPLPKMRTGQDK
ncbi:uncharacterized protein P174DRAFT_428472 [Aspergillus novofumigatus IBT 16806]|uniref:Uncharacterized protein n=1 Tax=Aspergillus novofumigatus (strain IBT 16806) TaxID=1392255 RepID=A0A2I1CHA2_ASPN1|nr:uncharacterized protein P174DRAFT_428472 [Aspergillus novofumigatus IBT 16806]PKX96984.1 hypothetical protein P174DRAFT_428472 [Aspergillus novofumigatus IBT 16806]